MPEEITTKKFRHSTLPCAIKFIEITGPAEILGGLHSFRIKGDPFARGWFCGYVGVYSAHPLYKKTSEEVYEIHPDFYVHGGLTFTGFGSQIKVNPYGHWFLGFDCAHWGDSGRWDYHSVREEVERLAEDIEKLSKGRL